MQKFSTRIKNIFKLIKYLILFILLNCNVVIVVMSTLIFPSTKKIEQSELNHSMPFTQQHQFYSRFYATSQNENSMEWHPNPQKKIISAEKLDTEERKFYKSHKHFEDSFQEREEKKDLLRLTDKTSPQNPPYSMRILSDESSISSSENYADTLENLSEEFAKEGTLFKISSICNLAIIVCI